MKLATVEFAEYPGDEYVVRISPVPIDDLFAINDALARWNTRGGLTDLKERFAPFIESWPLEAAPDAATIGQLDVNLLLALIRAWRKGVAEVPLPLPLPPSDGALSEALLETSSP